MLVALTQALLALHNPKLASVAESFMLFCIENYPPCDIARRQVEQVATTLKTVYFVDCEVNAQFCEALSVTAYPALLYTSEVGFERYLGSYQIKELARFLNNDFVKPWLETSSLLQEQYIVDWQLLGGMGESEFTMYFQRDSDVNQTSYEQEIKERCINIRGMLLGSQVSRLQDSNYAELLGKPSLFLIADASKNAAWLERAVHQIQFNDEIQQFYGKIEFCFVDTTVYRELLLNDFLVYEAPAVVMLWNQKYWHIDPSPDNLARELSNWWHEYSKF